MLFQSFRQNAGFCAIAMSAAIFAGGCGKGSSQNVQIDGVSGPNVAIVNNTMMMTAVLKNVSISGGVRIGIPHFPNSYVEVGPDLQSNGMLLSVGIDAGDLKVISGNTQVLEPTTLPGGRPLPGVSAGQLPAVAVQVPKLDNTTFYVGPQVFGAFVPVNFQAQSLIGTFRFYDGNNNPIGTISIVGADATGKNSGFLLMINLTGQVAQLIGM